MTVQFIPDGLPCNPSLLQLLPKPHVGIDALISNGYNTLDRVTKLLGGNPDQDTLNDMFSHENVLQIEGNAELNFQSNYFAAAYTPLSVKAFGVIRNEADPEAEISAVQESNLIMQVAYSFNDTIYLGLQAKTFSRKYIKERFQFTELLTDEGKDKIKPKSQRGFNFTPAATVILPYSFKPRVALMVANIGSSFGDTDYMNDPIDVEAGAGFTIPLGWAEIDVDLDYRSLSYDEDWNERFHLGSVLRFGSMSLMSGIDNFGLSGGVYYNLEQVSAGILFTTTQIGGNASSDYYANTVYLQVGYQL